MAVDKKTLLYVGGGLLGGFLLMQLFSKKSTAKNETSPGGHVASPPAGSTTDTAGNILNQLGKYIGQQQGANGGKSSKGSGPQMSSGGASGAGGGQNPGAGPIGNTAPPLRNSDGTQITYSDGSKIDRDNNYVDKNGNVIGYLGADGNLYKQNGDFAGDSNAGKNGLPDSTPNAQYIYEDGSYIDVNGYYHNVDGSVEGWAGTDGYMHDNIGNIIGAIAPSGAGPDLQGPPVDNGNGIDQYGNPAEGTLGDPVAQGDGYDQYGDPIGDPVDQGDGYDQYGDPYAYTAIDQGDGYDQYGYPTGDPIDLGDGYNQYGDPIGDPIDVGDGYDQYGDPFVV